MQILVLIAFVATLTTAEYRIESSVGLPTAIIMLAVYWGVAMLLARIASRCVVRGIVITGELSPAVVRRHRLFGAAASAWLIFGSCGLAMLGFGNPADLRGWPLLGNIVILLPFMVALPLVWTQEYAGWLANRRFAAQHVQATNPANRYWSRREFVSYNARHSLLFIAVPVFLIMFGEDVLTLYVQPLLDPHQAESITLGSASMFALRLAWAAAVFTIAPAIIVRIWRTEAMPPGEILTRLQAMSRRMGLRYRKILLWRTGGMISNAGVMGLVAPLRYVMLSDALLESMAPEQVEAIFAHEAGHITSHHIFYSAVFAASSLATSLAAGVAIGFLSPWPEAAPYISQAVIFIILAVLWVFGFGWISRRFERQSDVTAAWAMAHADGCEHAFPNDRGSMAPSDQITPTGAAIFAGGLERVAQLNGLPRNQRNWRHGSIAWRVQYILWLGSTGGSRRQIDRTVRLIKCGLWLSLAISAGVLAVELSM